MEVNSRQGSPCHQAAAEFMDMDDGGAEYLEGRAASVCSLGLRSTMSQTLADSFITAPHTQPPGATSFPAQARSAPPCGSKIADTNGI